MRGKTFFDDLQAREQFKHFDRRNLQANQYRLQNDRASIRASGPALPCPALTC